MGQKSKEFACPTGIHVPRRDKYYNQNSAKGYDDWSGEKSPRISSGSSAAMADIIRTPASVISAREGRRGLSDFSGPNTGPN